MSIFVKIINNQFEPITGLDVDYNDPSIVKVIENIPPYIKGRQTPCFTGIIDLTQTPPVTNYTIVDISVNDRKMNLINLTEILKTSNNISLETAFQRIDAITNCITHDDIDAFEQSIQQS